MTPTFRQEQNILAPLGRSKGASLQPGRVTSRRGPDYLGLKCPWVAEKGPARGGIIPARGALAQPHFQQQF